MTNNHPSNPFNYSLPVACIMFHPHVIIASAGGTSIIIFIVTL